MNPPRSDELEAIVRGEPWLLDVLSRARDEALPDWFIGAGAIRDVVWDLRFGHGFDPADIEDVDLVYFDPDDLSHESELAVEARLGPRPERPSERDLRWDVKNQARVHLWFESRFGTPADPLTSTTDGISTWPEHATCIGVRLEHDDAITITAPHGLDALLDGVWSTNAVRVTSDVAAGRLARKQVGMRWPQLRVV